MIKDIKTDLLMPHPKNPRLVMREDVIETIKAGLQDGFHPSYALQVIPNGETFTILSGHHRAEAAKREGLQSVPCFVRDDLDEEQAYMVLATANAQGELSPLEIGMHALHYVAKATGGRGQKGGLSAYAEQVGKHLGNLTTYRNAAEVAQTLLSLEGFLDKAAHLAAIHKLPRAGWERAAKLMLQKGWSAKETAEVVSGAIEAQTDKRIMAVFEGKTTHRELARIDETVSRIVASLEYEETRTEFQVWAAGEDPVDIKEVQAKRIEIENKESERREAEREPEQEPEAKPEPNLILADPPWKYDFAETDSRQIENHYPTGTVAEIADYMRKEMASENTAHDCVLFLWATVAKLTEAIDLIGELGFQYKTSAVWDKEKIGMGYWFRGQHELLLVATRGEFSPPEQENRRSSVFREPRGKHSAKPECVFQWIEAAFPNAVKMEIFQRASRPGWIGKGNEAK
jgi:N6-adenosine-specific RNA methylase IME4/ParB-like chromosome segregation protein Spo0J